MTFHCRLIGNLICATLVVSPTGLSGSKPVIDASSLVGVWSLNADCSRSTAILRRGGVALANGDNDIGRWMIERQNVLVIDGIDQRRSELSLERVDKDRFVILPDKKASMVRCQVDPAMYTPDKKVTAAWLAGTWSANGDCKKGVTVFSKSGKFAVLRLRHASIERSSRRWAVIEDIVTTTGNETGRSTPTTIRMIIAWEGPNTLRFVMDGRRLYRCGT